MPIKLLASLSSPFSIVGVHHTTASELVAYRQQQHRESPNIPKMSLKEADEWIGGGRHNVLSHPFFILMAGTKIAGQIILDYSMPNELFIDVISVLKQYSGSGASKALLNFAEVQARTRNLDRLDLLVHSSNTKAIAVYEKHGFVKTDEGGSSILYRKPLGNGSPR